MIGNRKLCKRMTLHELRTMLYKLRFPQIRQDFIRTIHHFFFIGEAVDLLTSDEIVAILVVKVDQPNLAMANTGDVTSCGINPFRYAL